MRTISTVATEIAEKLSYAKIVMLGEASHGTHEFYEWRRLISQELITNHGFNFIAVEGDWPPCYAANRLIRSKQSNADKELIHHFHRWPSWMWANTEVAELLNWMKDHNQKLKGKKTIGFFGLDVYSLFESIDEVLHTLKKMDPALAKAAKEQYACFDKFNRDERRYAQSLYFSPGCQTQVLLVLQDLLKAKHLQLSGESLFDAQQNARIVRNAEDYYRTMIHGNEDSWNVRDRHMMETLNILLSHHGENAKGIVWAHNTHIGDYRATSMVDEGQVNLGGLARIEWGSNKVALLGFGTYEGSVVASPAWDGPVQLMQVPKGKSGSYEDLFHQKCVNEKSDFIFSWLQGSTELELHQTRGHRAIGVVYDPRFESFGNYVPTKLATRYDGFLFIDQTRGLTPLTVSFDRREFPETFPGGF
ncbi:erythromycin esterase family protein [Bdellovibrio bacteriovorus]